MGSGNGIEVDQGRKYLEIDALQYHIVMKIDRWSYVEYGLF